MIDKKDVVRMRVPFPEVSSALAVNSHMYICIGDGKDKELVKCQTFKPIHLIQNKPPFYYIKEMPDRNRNPFQNPTTIDCDKSFCVSNVMVSTDLLATIRRDICNELFTAIEETIKSANSFCKVELDSQLLVSINPRISQP